MFYSHKIASIRPQDRVLEIGPGSTPHSRANAFLELRFDSELDRVAQRGGIEMDGNFSGRPVHYYDGGLFPFQDRQFDYVICSHVIEHVDNPAQFLQEVFRISGGRGYLEYPMITYEYLYDFSVHLHFIKFDAEKKVLRYLPKRDTGLAQFSPVSALLNQTLENGWDELCAANHALFFEGFEYDQPFAVERSLSIDTLCPPLSLVTPKRRVRKLVGQIMNHTGF
jgi:SAM-dependent methyltransferase